MINVSFGPNIFLGIIVSVGVLILYSLRNVKPEIARDEDIFFSNLRASKNLTALSQVSLM